MRHVVSLAAHWFAVTMFVMVLTSVSPAQQTPVDVYGDPLPKGAVARIGTIRFRVPNWIHDVQFSGDGSLLATMEADYAVRLWNTTTGRHVQHFPHRRGFQVRHFALSPDKRYLAKTTAARGVHVWDVPTQKLLWQGKLDPNCDFVQFCPDSKLMAVVYFQSRIVDGDSHIELRETGTWKLRHRVKLRAAPGNVAFSPDGDLLAVRLLEPGGKKGLYGVALLNTDSGKVYRQIHGHGQRVLSVTFAPDGKTLATAAGDKTVIVWDVDKAKERHRWQPKQGNLHTVVFLPNGKHLITGGDAGTLKLWKTATFKEMWTLKTDWHATSYPLAIAPNGKYMAGHTQLRFWTLPEGKEKLFGERTGHHVRFSADGTTLVSGKDRLAVWDVVKRKLQRVVPLPERRPFYEGLSPNGTRLPVADARSHAELWDLTKGTRIGPPLPRDFAQRATIAPDGKRAAGMTNIFGKFALFDTKTGKERKRLTFHGPPSGIFYFLRFPANGAFLAAIGNQNITGPTGGKLILPIWETATGQLHATIRSKNKGHERIMFYTLAFSGDARRVAVWRVNQVNLWEVASQKPLAPVKTQSWSIKSLALSQQGRLLACGGFDGTIRVYDLLTRQECYRLVGHQGQVDSLAFAPDGQLLASTAADETTLVWQITPPKTIVSKDSLPTLWSKLADSDANNAHLATWHLIATPTQTVPFLEKQLFGSRPNPQELRRLIRKLDSRSFRTRASATEKLTKYGHYAEPALQHAKSSGKPTLEAIMRIDKILAKLNPRSPAELRRLRAVMILDAIGNNPAHRVLQRIKKDFPHTRIGRAAGRSLARIG